MQTVAIQAPRQTGFCEFPETNPGPGEIKIRVERVGLCGSDLSTYRGLNPLIAYPRVPGHEIGGEVVAVGTDVTQCKPGDRVVVLPCTECGECSSCRAGRPNACRYNQTLGVQREGGMIRFLVLPARKVLVCNHLSFDELALVEPLSVGLHAARRATLQVGELAIVFGCGVIGLGAIAAAAAMGARVIAVDVDSRKADVALACGAMRFVNSAEEDLSALLAEIDGGRGPSAVIEAVGLDVTMLEAVKQVAFAGRVVFVGYAKKPVAFETPQFLLKELDIRGSRNATAADFTAVLVLMEQGRYPIQKIITTRYPLAQAGQAFADWDRDPGAVTKILIEMA